jgi:hypothetical protein
MSQPGSRYLINLPADFLLVGGGSILLFLALPFFYDGPMTPRLLTASLCFTWIGNWPHNSATNYRLYASTSGFRRYPFTAVGVPLMAMLGALASFAAPQTVAPYFVKITLSWILYHYCGQTIGISLLYARRAGYQPSSLERFLLVSFLYGTFFCRSLWSETSAQPLRYFSIVYPRFGVPVAFSYVAAAFTYGCAAGLLVILIRRSLRERKLPPLFYLLPAITQYVWFFVAGAHDAWVEFVPFFHGVQYLVIAWAMQLKEDVDQRATPPTRRWVALRSLRWYAINFVAGIAVFYFTPRLVSYVAGIDRIFVTGVLFTAFQVHHSFVDGVIWKLRTRSVSAPLLAHVPAMIQPARERVAA